LPVSTMWQWCVRRSSSAVVILASPKTVDHSAKSRFNAESILMRSPTVGRAEFPKTFLRKHSALGTQHSA